MTIHRSVAALLCAFSLAACDKNAVQDITAPMPSAGVAFFNFGVNAPGVNFYANDTKMTAIGSASCMVLTDANRELCTTVGAEAVTGVAYGGGAPVTGARYAAIEPGQYTFSGRIAAATDKDLPISNAPATIADGKSYSVYLSGFYNTETKTVDSFVIEDNFPAEIDWNSVHVRFVNASGNSQPVALSLRNPTTSEEVAVNGPVAYRNATPYAALLGTGTVDLVVRAAGSTTPVVTRTAVTLTQGRVYTITLRGDMTVMSTSATNRPFLDVTTNR